MHWSSCAKRGTLNDRVHCLSAQRHIQNHHQAEPDRKEHGADIRVLALRHFRDESKPPVRLNLWKFRVIVIFNQDNVIFHPVISAPFVGFCNEKHLLHVLKPCKIRAETVHLLPDK